MSRGDAHQRLDPGFHKPENSVPGGSDFPQNYPTASLGGLCSRIIQPFEFIRTYVEEASDGVPFLRAMNVTNGELHFEPLVYVDPAIVENAPTSRINEGDILITRTGANAGATCIVPTLLADYYVSSHTLRLIPKRKEVRSEYLELFLLSRWGKAQIEKRFTGAAQKQLQITSVSTIAVPLPPPDVQGQLVTEMQAARAARQAALAQADALLSGLDAYLLNELGLSAPQEDTRKVYAVRLKAAKRRFDCDFHSPKFRNLRMSIENSAFPVVTVGEICVSMESGFAAGRDDQSTADEEGIPHIRPMNITPNGEFTLEGAKYVPLQGLQTRDFLSANEVLFNNTNSMQWVGKAAVFEGGVSCACSNHITRLVLREDQAEPHFIALLFNMLRSLGLLGMLSTNFNNQAGINTETLESLRIPLPPLDLQHRIQAELVDRQQKARELRAQAAGEWEAAKARFERQLLGEEPRP